MHRLFWCRNSNSSLRNLSFPSTPPIPPRPDRFAHQRAPYLMLNMSGEKCGVNERNLRLPSNNGEPKTSKSCSLSFSDENISICYGKQNNGRFWFSVGGPWYNGNIRDAYWTSFWEEELVRLLCLGCNMFAQAEILSLESKCVSSDSLPSQFQSLLWKKQ